MITDNLQYTLECLRLATLYSQAPPMGGNHQDQAPVTFTLTSAQKPISSLNQVVANMPQSPLASPAQSYRSMTDTEENSVSSTSKQPKRSSISFDTIGVPNSTGKSQFSTRCDVVYKKLLRDFRRKLMTEFNSETNYAKNKRYKEDSYILECLIEFVQVSVPKLYGVDLS
jgi:hypothetical protein